VDADRWYTVSEVERESWGFEWWPGTELNRRRQPFQGRSQSHKVICFWHLTLQTPQNCGRELDANCGSMVRLSKSAKNHTARNDTLVACTALGLMRKNASGGIHMKRILLLLVLFQIAAAADDIPIPEPAQPTQERAPTILTIRHPDPSEPTFGTILRKSVLEIVGTCDNPGSPIQMRGTGFIVGVADSRLPHRYFAYLVTNRHIAECWDDKNRPRTNTIFLRMNLKDGTSRNVPVNSASWNFPTDDSVDLAVMPILPPEPHDTMTIPTSMFATKDYIKGHRISEGSPILFSGFFVQFPGEQKFQPIVRQGIVAMMPDEPIMNTSGKKGVMYLGDVHAFHGNSGSPVMVAADTLNIDGYHLLGVISGYYFETAEQKLEISTTLSKSVAENSGIAMIVPVDYIQDILDNPTLKQAREQAIQQFLTQPGIPKP
jgi:hypothetical protein